MNMKNTVILLIFLLSVLGLIIGVHYTEDVSDDNSQDDNVDSIDIDENELSIALENDENNELYVFFN